jgi:hypothetical protein
MSLERSSPDILKLPKSKEKGVLYHSLLRALNPEKYAKLKKAVEKIQQMINEPPKSLADYNDYRKDLQEEINEALELPAYERLKEHEHDPLVHFLHTAADILHNHSEGMSIFEDLGKELIGPVEKREYDFKEIGPILDEARKKSSSASVDTPQERLATHTFLHPLRFVGTILSRWKGPARIYDAYDTGNYNAELGTYHIDGVVFRSSAGPNPSHPDYRIFPAIHQRNSNLAHLLGVEPGIGPTHTQLILEGGEEESGPKERRNVVIQMANEQCTAMAVPMDGDAWRGKGAFQGIRTAHEFLTAVVTSMNKDGYRTIREGKKDNGFIIPPTLLTQAQIEEANAAFLSAFTHLERTAAWAKVVKEGRICKTLLLAYDAILDLKAMVARAEKQKRGAESHPAILNLEIDGLKIDITWNRACKQGVDRGAVLNMIHRMIVDAHAKKRFSVSDEQLYQYSGYTAGRARTVEARKIQEGRYEALRCFIDLIAEAPEESRAQFLAALQLPPIQFVPSNAQLNLSE